MRDCIGSILPTAGTLTQSHFPELLKDFCFSKLGKIIWGKESYTFGTTDLVI
jgi:hypothetical protein